MEHTLEGIPETMLIPLWARAEETIKKNPIIRDEKAIKMVSQIDYDFSKFKKSKLSQVGVSIRTEILDTRVREYLKRKPDSIIINLGSGLDTRMERFTSQNIRYWYDIDLPEAIGIRRHFFHEGAKNKFIAKSIFDPTWFSEIDKSTSNILILAEGLFMYFREEKIKKLFNELINNFPAAEIFFEMLAPFMVGKSKKHDSLKKINNRAEFLWGIAESKEIEKWDDRIRFQDDWNYFDYHKRRWGLFGCIARTPLFRPHFSSRIVHFCFEQRKNA